ncbi:MAG: gephyrin-like molybdotransferase Glp [Pseudomonadota bacterium]
MDLAEANQALRDQITAVGDTQTLPIEQALNRVLAESIVAPTDMPPFRASAMDGYAIQTQDLAAGLADQKFSVIGTSWAGHPFSGSINPGQAVRVFTGAVVPEGGGQVLLQEELEGSEPSTQSLTGQTADENASETVFFRDHVPAEPYIRPAGHDVVKGQLLLIKGTLLNHFHVGMLAACGVAKVSVSIPPVVGVFSTGDELVDPGIPPDQLQPGQIYDSNRLTVLSLLSRQPLDIRDLGRLPDNEEAVKQAIQSHSKTCHALITSGGVSVGDADFVTRIIEELGQLSFWKLNLKPGKPLAYGQIRSGEHTCHIFGLPGNPVSTIVTLLLVAKPALAHLAGAIDPEPATRVLARLDGEIRHTSGRAEYQRGTLRFDTESNTHHVSQTGDQSSNRLSTFAQANCLIEVPKEADNLAHGTLVQVLPFSGLL